VTLAKHWNLVSAGPSRERLKIEHLLEGPVVTVNRAVDIVDLGIPVHFAAFADGPRAIWEPLGLEKYIRPGMQVWCSLRQVSQKIKVDRPARMRKGVPNPAFLKTAMKVLPKPAMDTLASLAGKYLMEPADSFEVEAPGAFVLQLWDAILPASVGVRVLPHGYVQDVDHPTATRHAFTTICALQRIFMYRPEKVRILCADMAGSWIPGETEEQCMERERRKVVDGKSQAVLNRWKHERVSMDRAIEQYRKSIAPVEIEWVSP
jgi:hypothetical protein